MTKDPSPGRRGARVEQQQQPLPDPPRGLFSADSFERLDRFRGSAEENLGAVHELEYLLLGFLHWPEYDEAYKLGLNPDLESFGECLRHLNEAHAALKRVESSCRLPGTSEAAEPKGRNDAF